MSLCDGFLFTGGQDVSPVLYGENSRQACGEVCEKRDAFERRLFTQALKQDKTMLGICRGIQFFNACLGGTLYQDLPTEHPSHVACLLYTSVIGTKFVLYRESHSKPKEKRIQLVKPARKKPQA